MSASIAEKSPAEPILTSTPGGTVGRLVSATERPAASGERDSSGPRAIAAGPRQYTMLYGEQPRAARQVDRDGQNGSLRLAPWERP
jgi:hypothetical protein